MSFEGLQDAPQVSDRREVLSSLLDEAETASNVSRETTVKSEPVAAKTTEDRPRDETGKFAPKAVAAPAPVASSASAAPSEPPVWERAPKSWKPDKHALWSTATPELKQYAYTREEEMRAGVEPLIPKAQLADQITKVAEPYMNTIRGMGLELPAAVEGLMKADHELRTLPPEQKLQKLIGLANYYGIRLDGAQQPQAQPDQQYYGLHNELLSVKGEIASWKQQQEEAKNQAVLAEINSFAPKAEFFEEARPAMIKLLDTGMATDLQDAYEKAVRLDPELFETVQARKQAAEAQSAITAKNMAAQRAKAAAVSVRSSTPGSSTPTKAQDRRSVIAEQFDNLSERF